MFLNLTVFGLLSGVILAGVFGVADPLIKANKAEELRKAIFTVLPDAEDYVKLEKHLADEMVTIYVGYGAGGELVGVAFKADGNGFSGNVGVMAGLDMAYLRLKGIEILDQLETPGLGDRIREPGFKDQFKGVEVKPRLEYIKYRKPEKPNQIQAITGATISSNAVITNINNMIVKLEQLFPSSDVAEEAAAARAAHPEEEEGGAVSEEEDDDGE